MPHTYVLWSDKFRKSYTGCTTDLPRRLKEHNSGQCDFSRSFRPWRIIYSEEFQTLIEARRREKYLKSHAGRKIIKSIIERLDLDK